MLRVSFLRHSQESAASAILHRWWLQYGDSPRFDPPDAEVSIVARATEGSFHSSDCIKNAPPSSSSPRRNNDGSAVLSPKAHENRHRMRILVSRCLLGDSHVAYHGKHLRAPGQAHHELKFFTDLLQDRLRLVSLYSICPEVDLMKLSTPRPPLKLVGTSPSTLSSVPSCSIGCQRAACGLKLVEASTQSDMTSRMVAPLENAEDLAVPLRCEESMQTVLVSGPQLAAMFDGAVLKARSPSCGPGDARVYDEREGGLESTTKYRTGLGLFPLIAFSEKGRNAAVRGDGDRCEDPLATNGGDLHDAAPLPIISERTLHRSRRGRRMSTAPLLGTGRHSGGICCVCDDAASFFRYLLQQVEARR